MTARKKGKLKDIWRDNNRDHFQWDKHAGSDM